MKRILTLIIFMLFTSIGVKAQYTDTTYYDVADSALVHHIDSIKLSPEVMIDSVFKNLNMSEVTTGLSQR